MAIATRTPTKQSKSRLWELKLSKAAFRPQLNAEFCFDQLGAFRASVTQRRRVVPAGSKEFYFTGADLYRWHCANSFSEKEPAKHCSPTVTGRRASKTFHARPAASASGLAQAQFSYQRSHPFAFREAVGWPCGAAIPESSRRRDLHYLDRSRLISDSNSRGQYPDRPDLVEMA